MLAFKVIEILGKDILTTCCIEGQTNIYMRFGYAGECWSYTKQVCRESMHWSANT